MSVYVDDVRHPLGRMVMCHMWADSEEELMSMAAAIGLYRRHVQGHPLLSAPRHQGAGWLHFDICRQSRARAVRAGAVEADRYGPAEHVARLKLAAALAAGDRAEEHAARRRIAHIAGKRQGRSRR